MQFIVKGKRRIPTLDTRWWRIAYGLLRRETTVRYINDDKGDSSWIHHILIVLFLQFLCFRLGIMMVYENLRQAESLLCRVVVLISSRVRTPGHHSL